MGLPAMPTSTRNSALVVATAMAFDGVKKETVKVFVLDKEFKV